MAGSGGSPADGPVSDGNSSADVAVERETAPPGPVPVQVVASTGHSCALMDDGTVKCWGAGESAPITGGGDALRPTTVAGVANVAQLAVGYYHTYAVGRDGAVHGWGVETQDGVAQSDTSTPLLVSGLPSISRVGTGIQHACGAAVDKTVWCWGSDQYGAIGVRPAGANQTSRALGTGAPTDVFDVAAGGFTTCAITNVSGGTLWCWGSLPGDGRMEQPTPYRVLMNGVRQVGAGEGHVCALAADGSVRCWGGTPANGGAANTLDPHVVPGLEQGVLSIGAGVSATCAVMADHTVRCWGGTLTTFLPSGSLATPTPTVIPGLDGVKAVAVGGGHACALRNDDSLVCWGNNSRGQLGDGTRDSRAAPRPVLW